MRRLWDLRSADRGALRGAVLPHRGGRRGVAGHGVASVGTVLQRNFAVFVQLLELGSPVLEPDLDLREKKSVYIDFNAKEKSISMYNVTILKWIFACR